MCDYSGCDLQIAFFFTFRYFGPPPNATTPHQPHRKQRLHLPSIASPTILLPRQHRRHLPPPAEHRLTVLLPPAAYHRRAKRRILAPSKPFVKGKAEPRMQMSGSREVHAPLFSRPMGERGSAHQASVIRIFAYAGYKRDEHGRFVLALTGRFFSLGMWKNQGFFLFLFLHAVGREVQLGF